MRSSVAVSFVQLLFFSQMMGCSALLPVSEDNFGARFASSYCKVWKKCYRGQYEDEFSDMADCRDEVADQYEDIEDMYDDWGCDFESDEAKSCLNSMAMDSCEDWYDGDMAGECDEVWDC